ncbi:Endonuclease 8-like 3 [Bienertia sinuspersici]
MSSKFSSSSSSKKLFKSYGDKTQVYCHHGLRAIVQTTKKMSENHGRRFYGCSLWKEEYCTREVEVILGLAQERKALVNELKRLKMNAMNSEFNRIEKLKTINMQFNFKASKNYTYIS